jgi:hypothetical protein
MRILETAFSQRNKRRYWIDGLNVAVAVVAGNRGEISRALPLLKQERNSCVIQEAFASDGFPPFCGGLEFSMTGVDMPVCSGSSYAYRTSRKNFSWSIFLDNIV